MKTLRRANQRGSTKLGWLDSRHTFSFGGFYHPEHMGFGDLRVINDDRVVPGAGFGTHPHRDMEIISVVLEGGLAHRDSMGNGDVIRPGEVQVMTAGTGITHSEYNASETEPVHFLQIWIEPAERGTEPRYAQKAFDRAERDGRLQLVASPDGADGSLPIGQDARMFLVDLREGQSVEHEVAEGRRVWAHVATGRARVDGEELRAGDGIALERIDRVVLEGPDAEAAQVLLFDLR